MSFWYNYYKEWVEKDIEYFFNWEGVYEKFMVLIIIRKLEVFGYWIFVCFIFFIFTVFGIIKYK